MTTIPAGFSIFDWELGYAITKTGNSSSETEKCAWVPEIGTKRLMFSDRFILSNPERFEI